MAVPLLGRTEKLPGLGGPFVTNDIDVIAIHLPAVSKKLSENVYVALADNAFSLSIKFSVYDDGAELDLL